ncbi:DUF7002 family protein [Streptomyces sp. NPDC002018]|uniref:DUF7002 family protein n=1 Tax=Streptomyces sp. NPDC002018 TaxID=3364629 RepID=UPI0036AE103D
MRREELISKHPTVYHVAEDGAWPSIKAHGLLSTEALVDLFAPDPATRHSILSDVRRSSVPIEHPRYGTAVIRDQRPLRFLDQVLTPDTTRRQFLNALNGRVFFWLSSRRLHSLLHASRNRRKPAQTVLHIDTAALLARHGDRVQLAPYNTGSTYVPTAPRRGAGVFVDVDDYPYDSWAKRRGKRRDAAVELTVPHSVPAIEELASRVERWRDGHPVDVLHTR